MPFEKISFWAREFSSLMPKAHLSILNVIHHTYKNLFITLTRNGYLQGWVDSHPLIDKIAKYRLFMGKNDYKIKNFKDKIPLLSPLLNENQSSMRMATLTVLTGLSLFGGLSIGYWVQTPRSTSIGMPIGGVLPNMTPRAIPGKLWEQSGQESWLNHRLGNHAQLPSTAMNGFCHPLQGKGFLSQGTSVGTHQGRMKYAYDFGVPIGMPVYAMQSGQVIGMRDTYPDKGGQKENADKFNYIWLEHSNGFRSAYIHLQQNFRQKIPVKLYDWVQTGQLIGFSGNSGWSTAPHLHVEVHSIIKVGFGQTLPFVINSKCYASPFAAADLSN